MSAPSLPSLLLSHWQPSWSVLFGAAVSVALYALGVARLGGRWPARATLAFVAGVGCVVVALQSGIDAYDDRMLSVHMVQHMVLLLLAPLLLLAGRPVLLTLRALPPSGRRRVVAALARTRPYTGPVPSLAFFCAVVALTHLSRFYDAAVLHDGVHYLEHALYVVAGLLLLSPLLDGDPAPAHRLSGLGRLLYVIAAMIPMALIGAYLNRHATLVYGAYAAPARALGISGLDDQAQAGAIMWVAGNTVMAGIGLWTALAAMLAEERRQRARDARALAAADGGGGR
jgi:putative copper resistance protein D